MVRTLTSGITTKLGNKELYPFYAVRLNFDSGSQYLWTGIGSITIDSNTYTGLGHFLEISQIQESQDISAKNLSLTLSGIPSNLLALALTDPYQGRTCTVYLGFMTSWESPDTNPDTIKVFHGYMDQLNINEGPEVSTIVMNIENRLIDLQRAKVRRYTSQNQQIRFPNDKAFDFVESMQDQQLVWGGR